MCILMSVPTTPVRNLKNKSLTSRSASFMWDPLLCWEQNGRAKGYHYRLFDMTHQPGVIVNEATITATQTSFTLIPFVQYRLFVTFDNDIGSSPGSILDFQAPPERTKVLKTISTCLIKVGYNNNYYSK